jgi:hypothetical protein
MFDFPARVTPNHHTIKLPKFSSLQTLFQLHHKIKEFFAPKIAFECHQIIALPHKEESKTFESHQTTISEIP